MKILHVGKYFPPYAGGMETYLRDLMAAQARQGLDTAALVHQSDIGFNSQHELIPSWRAATIRYARRCMGPFSLHAYQSYISMVAQSVN